MADTKFKDNDDGTRLDLDDGGKPVDPNVDHGYAWVILIGCFTMYLFLIGTIKSYGILYTEMVEYYATGSGSTAWVGSTVLVLMLGLSPISNLLSQLYTFRRVSFAGGVFLCLGYFLSGFVQKMPLLYLTFGLCSGLGYGLSFAPCSTIISYYFKDHRALANGIAVSASGFGALTFPFLYRFLIDKYGLRGTFWIIGAILSNVCVAACVFRQPPLLIADTIRRKAVQHRNNDQNALLEGKQSSGEQQATQSTHSCGGLQLRLALFKNARFTIYCLGFVLCMNGYGNNLILIPSQIKALGYGQYHVVYGVTIMGGCEVVARISFGWFADKKLVKRKHIFLISMMIGSIMSFIAPLFNSFIFMAVYAGIIGTFPGSFWSLVSVLIIDIVGMEDFTPAVGLVNLCLACGCVISQPVVGWLEDYTGDWHASFILTGILFLLGALVVSMEPFIIRCCTKPKSTENFTDSAEHIPLRNKTKLEVTTSYETGSPGIKTSDEEGLLLEDNGAEVSFTSARISRIYRPYDTELRSKTDHQTSPVPVVDANNV